MRPNAFWPLQSQQKIQVDELVWPAKAKSAARSPLHSTQKEKVKFTFNITKCDKIFDELLKHGNIKLLYIITSVDELKGRVYCKWHGSFLHNTNNCDVFRRQIQSAINEGRLRFQKEVRIDRPPVPATILESTSKKFIVWPCAADKSKDKNISIGDPCTPNMSHIVVTRKASDKRKT
jgi:beta-xylosidase